MLFILRSLLFAPLFRLFFRPQVIGRSRFPRRGPVLIASNHHSFIDSVVITLLAPRRVAFLAKSEYFSQPGLRGRISRGFFTSIGAIPIDRGAGRAAQEALDRGLQVLEQGEAFAIYPEGTRSLDGRLYKGRTGVAWLALSANVPIVPVSLKDTAKLHPVGSRRLRRTRITVEFGAPITGHMVQQGRRSRRAIAAGSGDATAAGPENTGRTRRELTDDVMARVQQMSGQEPAGTYNSPPRPGLPR